ncbi:CHAT domain-containing protein [Suillus tomentosus]|nr:CHAT domain-containing protein [Suillus tomentosus]
MTDRNQYFRLEVMRGKNLDVPSFRIPVGIYVSIFIDSKRCWKSTVGELLSDSSVAWNDAVTLSPRGPKLSLKIMASFENPPVLGRGEVISELEISWHELCERGDEPFDLYFSPIRDVQPSLTLKVAVVYGSGIHHHTYVGHMRFAKYIASENLNVRATELTEVLKHFQFVLEQCPVNHPHRAAALTNLAWARLQGYILKDLQDIDLTISLFRDALALCPQDHPNYPFYIYHLTEALTRCPTTAASIRETAQLYHELLPLCREGTYLWSIAIGDNCIGHVIRECNNLPIDVSDEGIHLRRIVLQLCQLGHQCRLDALTKLAKALEVRFEQRGSIDDINESIQLHRDAVSLCPEGHPDRGTYLRSLAVALSDCRFNHEGKSHDIDEAISLHEEALLLHPVGHESRDRALSSLGRAILYRFQQCSGISDINDVSRAINLHRETLMLRPLGHPRRDTTLNDLACALVVRYRSVHTGDDLDEAIGLFRESLLLPEPERRRTRSLSLALCCRFKQTRIKKDIEEAIHLCQRSLNALPSLHPEKCLGYMQLQTAYLCRYQVLRNAADLSLAVDNFGLASRHPTQGFPQRIQAASSWVVTAESYCHESALEAYAMCFELLDGHLATRSTTISRREAAAAFYYTRSLPADAASCAVRRKNLLKAVELVEQGRGQQWSLASRLRTPLEDLNSTNSLIAQEFLKLSNRLSNVQGFTGSTDQATVDGAEKEYRTLTKQWNAVVAEIRNLRGFSRFLLSPSYKELQVAARRGPVIILIASKYSCSAVIVPTAGEPHHVAFPGLALADLEKLKNDFAKALRHAAGMRQEDPRKDLRVLLRAIWKEIMLPIVNILQDVLKLPPRSRIWLCPTAAFTGIPLHAANPFRMNADCPGKVECLEDIYICSYTPTLSALIRARRMMKTRVTPTFVAIGQSQPGAGQGTVLATVDTELDEVHKHVPPNVRFTNLSGDEATQAGALEALRCNTWVHLACHGKQDHDQPYNSRFAMRDKPLTLLDIVENNSPQAEFAFLSACHTAAGDKETPDEVIHLAAGLQFSGFKSVIGTLWAVDDAVAKHVVEAFYKKMFKEGVMDCTKAALALNYATAAVKKEVPLEQRIVFIHIGV